MSKQTAWRFEGIDKSGYDDHPSPGWSATIADGPAAGSDELSGEDSPRPPLPKMPTEDVAAADRVLTL